MNKKMRQLKFENCAAFISRNIPDRIAVTSFKTYKFILSPADDKYISLRDYTNQGFTETEILEMRKQEALSILNSMINDETLLKEVGG